MAKLAFLGAGLIGAGLAEAACKRGGTVAIWNRTRAKAQALALHGARVAESPADAIAGAERVHLALADDAVVDAVLDGCGAALVGPLVIDHSTTSPDGTAARAARLEAKGVRYLHCPVFMSPAMARSAGGIMLAAGPKALFDEAAEGLRAMTGSLEHLGERRDLAAAYKLFGNAMILSIVGGLADVFAMAASLGIPASDAHALFSKFNPVGTINYRGSAMARGDYQPGFELSMARKDARLMVEAAAGAPLAVLPGLIARMDELLARGLAADDVGVLAVDAVPRASRR